MRTGSELVLTDGTIVRHDQGDRKGQTFRGPHEEFVKSLMIESGPGDIFHPLGEDVEDFVWWHGVGSWQRQRDWIPLRRLGGIDAVRGDRPVGESREGAKGECKGKVGRGGM